MRMQHKGAREVEVRRHHRLVCRATGGVCRASRKRCEAVATGASYKLLYV